MTQNIPETLFIIRPSYIKINITNQSNFLDEIKLEFQWLRFHITYDVQILEAYKLFYLLQKYPGISKLY